MAVKISPELRKLYADKTFDLTNLGASALLVGQFFSKDQFSWGGILIGLVLIGAGYRVSYLLYPEGQKGQEGKRGGEKQ